MKATIVLGTLAGVLAVPAPAAAPVPHPQITPAPVLSQKELERRLDIGSYVDSVISGIGSDVSGFVASGVPQYFNDLPTGTAVEKSLGISSSDLASKPTQALNVPYVNEVNAVICLTRS